MSISPDSGHGPYVSLTGIIHMAGQSQSPEGSVAVTSTRPYVMVAPFLEFIRPDLTGFTMVWLVTLVTATQLKDVSEEQIPCEVKFMTLFVSISFSS